MSRALLLQQIQSYTEARAPSPAVGILEEIRGATTEEPTSPVRDFGDIFRKLSRRVNLSGQHAARERAQRYHDRVAAENEWRARRHAHIEATRIAREAAAATEASGADALRHRVALPRSGGRARMFAELLSTVRPTEQATIPPSLLEEIRAQREVQYAFDCQVCMEPVEETKEWTNVCGEDCPAQVCGSCLRQHLSIITQASFNGMVPFLSCPACPKRLVKPTVWQSILSDTDKATVQLRCNNLLTLQCAGCHSRNRSLLFSDASEEEIASSMQLLSPEQVTTVTELKEAYLNGSLDPTQMHGELQNILGALLEPFMRPFLGSIVDIPRRALLQLRHFRLFPRVHSLCCNRLHCFNCRIRDFHENQTCQQYQAQRSNIVEDLAQCPQCHVWLVKGDGCSSLRCPCGHSFSWGSLVAETRSRLSRGFIAKFPTQEEAMRAAVLAIENGGIDHTEADAVRRSEPDAFQAAQATIFEENDEDGRLLARAILGQVDESPMALAWTRQNPRAVVSARRLRALGLCTPFVAAAGGEAQAARVALAVVRPGALSKPIAEHPLLVEVAAGRPVQAVEAVAQRAELAVDQVERLARMYVETRGDATLVAAQAVVDAELAEERTALEADWEARYGSLDERYHEAMALVEHANVHESGFREACVWLERNRASYHAKAAIAEWEAAVESSSTEELARTAMAVLRVTTPHPMASQASAWAAANHEAMVAERERLLETAQCVNHRRQLELTTYIPCPGCFCRPAHANNCPYPAV